MGLLCWTIAKITHKIVNWLYLRYKYTMQPNNKTILNANWRFENHYWTIEIRITEIQYREYSCNTISDFVSIIFGSKGEQCCFVKTHLTNGSTKANGRIFQIIQEQPERKHVIKSIVRDNFPAEEKENTAKTLKQQSQVLFTLFFRSFFLSHSHSFLRSESVPPKWAEHFTIVSNSLTARNQANILLSPAQRRETMTQSRTACTPLFCGVDLLRWKCNTFSTPIYWPSIRFGMFKNIFNTPKSVQYR